jgi:hypothetical protein
MMAGIDSVHLVLIFPSAALHVLFRAGSSPCAKLYPSKGGTGKGAEKLSNAPDPEASSSAVWLKPFGFFKLVIQEITMKTLLGSVLALGVISSGAVLFAPSASAQTIATLSNGHLSLTTPNGDQSVKVEVGPSASQVRVFGFPGLTDGAPYFGVTGVTVTTGNGQDFVEFDIDAPQGLDVNIDTRGGQGEAKILWDILPGLESADASVTLASTGGLMPKATIEVVSEAPSASVSIDTGAAQEVAGKVVSPNASDFLKVALASAARKSSFDVTSAASMLELDVAGGLTTAQTEMKYDIAQTLTANIAVNWSLLTGAADDKIEAKLSAPGSTIVQRGLIRTGGGNDFALIESEGFSTVFGQTLDGGAGADELSIVTKGRYQASTTLRTRMVGGAGDDKLVLTTDTGIFGAGQGVPELFPVINCGDGIDQYNAFGQIISCESRL